MRIVNFNHIKKNTWISWNKEYCYDLSAKITSLYDYIVWNHPAYLVFNSPYNKQKDFKPYVSLRHKTSAAKPENNESRLPENNYFEQVIKHNDQDCSIFFANRLNYHQGFLNLSEHGDGFIALKYNSNTDISNGITKTIDGKQFVLYPFPSGYVCILNKQITGSTNKYNTDTTIDSFLIIPQGNGGYYNIVREQDSIIGNYKDNDFNQFINKISFNLAVYCRYINPVFSTTGVFNKDDDTFSISNYTKNNNTIQQYIQDSQGNLWTGDQYLIGTVVNNNNERIITDALFDIHSGVLDNQQVFSFRIEIPEGLSIEKNNVILY